MSFPFSPNRAGRKAAWASGNSCAPSARTRWRPTRPENFSADIVTKRILWRRTFIINEPSAIRHVLLDNAANYTKSEVSRRLLEPGSAAAS